MKNRSKKPGVSVPLCAEPGESVPLYAEPDESVTLCADPGENVPLCAYPDESVPLCAEPGDSIPLCAELGVSVPLYADPGVSVPLCAESAWCECPFMCGSSAACTSSDQGKIRVLPRSAKNNSACKSYNMITLDSSPTFYVNPTYTV